MLARPVPALPKNAERRQPAPATSALPEMLAELAASAQLLREVHAQVDVNVVRARAHGARWRALGDALGVSATSAHTRYAG